MSKLAEFLKKFYGHLDQVIIHYDGGVSCECFQEISPRKFLYYSKIDNEIASEHSLINSLTNAKRAIDCQMDCTLETFGAASLDKSLESFVNSFVTKGTDTAYKLKVVQAYGIAPSRLVSEIRSVRHKLEHQYKAPNQKDALLAIDTAELFLIANESKTTLIENHLTFIENEDDLYQRGINLKFDTEKKRFLVDSQDKDLISEAVLIENNEVEYHYLIRLINTVKDEFELKKTLVKLFEHFHVDFEQGKLKVAAV